MAKITTENLDLSPQGEDPFLEEQLYARHAEIKSLEDLKQTRGTPIPALFNLFYKFVQNPSTVSVDTYKRMVDTDDTIGSGVDFLTTLLAASLGQYQHPSEEITEWVNAALKKVDGGFHNVVKELLSATWAGFCVQEKVWANTDLGFVIERFVSMPPQTILFEVDRVGRLTPDGILQYQRNYNPALLSSGGYFGTGFSGNTFAASTRPDPYAKFGDLPFPIRVSNTFNYLSIRIPTQKCVHYGFDAQGKFGNPYGRSLLRRVYKYYLMKDAFLQMLSTALDRKGTPIMVVFADPHATVLDENKYGGQNVKGTKAGKRADQAAADAFKNVHNDSVIVLPGKKGQVYEVDPVQVTSNADVFLGALDFCNKSIMRGLLIPSLIFTSGDGTGSYALGQEHAKTFDKLKDGMLQGLKQVILDQVVKELIAYNFPRSAWEKDGIGDFSKREFAQDEIDKVMSTYEKAISVGAIDVNDLADLNKIRETIGFDMKLQDEKKPNEQGLEESTEPVEVRDQAEGTVVDGAPESVNEVQDLALNGAQVTSMVDIVKQAATGEIPRTTAVEIIIAAFPMIDRARAERILGPIGQGFTPTQEEQPAKPDQEPQEKVVPPDAPTP